MIYTGRGSTALWAVLSALKQPGAGVIVPANICEIVPAVILRAGWRPVFCDVDPISGNAGVEHLAAARTPDTVGAIAVANFGTPVAIDEVRQWATTNGIFLIEDVCNALGATHQGRLLGTWGDAAIFSFGYAKIVEHRTGGAVTVADRRLRARVEEIIASMPLFGLPHAAAGRALQAELRIVRGSPRLQTREVYLPLYDRYVNDFWYRIGPDDIAAISTACELLPENLRRRREIAALYEAGIRHDAVAFRPRVAGDAFWRFTFTVAATLRDRWLEALRAERVLASAWYPSIAHLFGREAAVGDHPGAEQFGDRVINLFTDDRVSYEDAARTVAVINQFA